MSKRSSGSLYVMLLGCVDHTLLVARGTWGSKRSIVKTMAQIAGAIRIDFLKNLDKAHWSVEEKWLPLLPLPVLTLRPDEKRPTSART